ncbi:MAG: coproporphyrinogen III oxidase, partial [Allosphingosinicella sp.]
WDGFNPAAAGLRRASVASLNFDLMYGLPGQTRADLEATLAAAIVMRPDRIALFGYAHVPHLIPRQRRIEATLLPPPDERFLSAERGFEILTAAGYMPVGFDHFALPGDPLARAAAEGRLRRNFQGFTDDPAEISIGLGASAISAFPAFLLQNEKNAGRYRMLVSAGALPVARGLMRSAEDRTRAALIESILCRGDADISRLDDREEVFWRLLPYEERGLVGWDGFTLRLADEARPYARGIAAALDRYRRPAARRFSSAI